MSKQLSCGNPLPHLLTCESCAAASCISAADHDITIELPQNHSLLAGSQLGIIT